MTKINSLISFLIGTVRVEISGDYCERFLNILAANCINFSGISKHKDKFQITVLKRDFHKLKKLRKNCFLKIKIIKKSGIPFIINKYRFRCGMIVGLFLFITILSVLSTRLWIIKINGNHFLDKNVIYNSLRELGVREGISMSDIDTDILKQKLILNGENIAWSSLNIQGSVLEVNLTEYNYDNTLNQPSNLVAEEDGVIKRIDVQNGNICVKNGDAVYKGQLLVSGVISFGTGSYFVNSNGKIIAEVIKTENIILPKNYSYTVTEGDKSKKYILNIVGIKIPIYFGDVSKECKIETGSTECNLFGGRIPIEITTINRKKISIMSQYLSAQEALEISKKEINEKYGNENYVNFEITDYKIEESETDYIITYRIKFLKNIAKKEIINYEING